MAKATWTLEGETAKEKQRKIGVSQGPLSAGTGGKLIPSTKNDAALGLET